MRLTLLGTHFAARLAIMYKFLCPFITLYSSSVRRYGGDLFSGRLCLPVKITETSGVLLSISSEFDGHSGAGKKLSWPITF